MTINQEMPKATLLKIIGIFVVGVLSFKWKISTEYHKLVLHLIFTSGICLAVLS